MVENPDGGRKLLKNSKGDTIWEVFKDGKVARRDPYYGRIEKDAKGDTLWIKYGKEEESEEHDADHQTSDQFGRKLGKVDLAEITKRANETKCPADAYSGADKQALKNIVIADWNKLDLVQNTKYKLLKVYITGTQWQTQKGYDKVGASYSKYDNSTLKIKMVYETTEPDEMKAKVARIQEGYLYKNNLNTGSKTELGKVAWEDYRSYIFISNVK